MIEFREFPKIARLSRECIITEKIDGTNASVWIEPTVDQGTWEIENGIPLLYTYCGEQKVAVRAASRTRFITARQDNYGFAHWVFQHGTELAALGVGVHFGEWWGPGIQRGYGLKEKCFSLFNVTKWGESRPSCVSVVPVLLRGVFDTKLVEDALAMLRAEGSRAAPGFMRPEGVVVYHVAGNLLFKKTLEKDDEWKGKTDQHI